MSGPPEVSVVVPMYNEAGNVVPLVREVRAALDGRHRWELILVDDGSSDDTADRIRACRDRDGRVKLARLARNYGQSVAMRAGFDSARAPYVVSMDGDLQNDPADIPQLIEKLEQGYDMVVGHRKDRWEGSFLSRKVPSVVANGLIRWITGAPFHDNGCSLKGFRRDILDDLPLYAEMHRFLGPLVLCIASPRTTETPVSSRPRRRGTSKYGLSRAPRVLVDLLTLTMLRYARGHPLKMFGGTGLASLVLSGAVLGIAALHPVPGFGASGPSVVPLAVGVTWLGLGLFLSMLGLIGEMLVTGGRDGPSGTRTPAGLQGG